MNDTTNNTEQVVRAALREYLETTDFLAFEQIIKRLLYKSGYVSVQFIGRNFKRGRTPKGGLDLTARSTTELSTSLTIAQIKQYKRVVSRRFVDELRGAMLRLGASQGLLVTMSTFSKVAHQAARESVIAPITLLEGEEILDLLIAYRIGVKFHRGTWAIDSGYLDALKMPMEASGIDIKPETAMGTYERKLISMVPTRQRKTRQGVR